MRAPESVFPGRPALAAGRVAAMALTVVVLSGCGIFNRASTSVAGVLTPYKVEVVQGNFVSSEQVAVLKPGLTAQPGARVAGHAAAHQPVSRRPVGLRLHHQAPGRRAAGAQAGGLLQGRCAGAL